MVFMPKNGLMSLIKSHASELIIFHGNGQAFGYAHPLTTKLWWAFYPFPGKTKYGPSNVRDISDADIAKVTNSHAGLVELIMSLSATPVG